MGLSVVRLLLALVAAASLAAQGETILRVGGTGAGLATAQRLGESLARSNTDLRVNVLPSLGSSGGLRALARGDIDIAIAGAPLSPADEAAGLVARPFGRTALAFVTRSTAVDNLTTQDVIALLLGTRRRWDDGTPARLVLRPPNDTDTYLLAALSPDIAAALAKARLREGMLVAITDQEAADLIERLPGGIGTSTLALVTAERRPLRALALDGVRPDLAQVASGRYPLVKSLFWVTRGPPSGAAAAFLELAASPAGRKAIAEMGFAAP